MTFVDDGSAACLHRDVDFTAEQLIGDSGAYRRVMKPLARNWEKLANEFLQPPLHLPRHPVALARFAIPAVCPATFLAKFLFKHEPARALFAGIAAHSFLPLEALVSSAFAFVLGLAGHSVGWPIPRGGSQRITNALANYLRELGGTIETNHRVDNLNDLPKSRAILLDVTEACRHAGTLHLGGSIDEIATTERDVARGKIPERPFVLVAQQSLFDETRAPGGQHTLWVYCHVPFNCAGDMTDRIESQVERFAPGFRDCILSRHKTRAADLGKSNPNLTGGDINGGAANLMQLIARPILSPTPYRTPMKGIYLCSSSTPPGGGVHGMCGYHAAGVALHDCFSTRKL